MFYFSRTAGNPTIFRSGSRRPGTFVLRAGTLVLRAGTIVLRAGTTVLRAGTTATNQHGELVVDGDAVIKKAGR